MALNIPKDCRVRWQAALAVIEDLEADESAPFNQRKWADKETLWEKTNGCGSAACLGGYISVSPYCRKLGYPKHDNGNGTARWLMGDNSTYDPETGESVSSYLFDAEVGNNGPRAQILAELKRRIKEMYKNATGKTLRAPWIFWV